jgi:hypothetical protein
MTIFKVLYNSFFVFFGTFTVGVLASHMSGSTLDLSRVLMGAIGGGVASGIWFYWRGGKPEAQSAGNDPSTKGMPTG